MKDATNTTTTKATAFHMMKSENSIKSSFQRLPDSTAGASEIRSDLKVRMPRKPVTPSPNVLQVVRDATKTEARQFAEISLSPVTMSAVTARAWAKNLTGSIGLNESLAIVNERADSAKDGNLDDAKAMLVAQATALDAIFNEMASKASTLMRVKEDGTWSFTGETMDALMRTAFKAQSQCRATLQTLGDLVNPRSVAFIKQTNNANGPQQVNNGHAPVGNSQPAESKLLEENSSERMDTGTQAEAVGIDQDVATVGEVHRPTVGRGAGRGGAKR